MRDFAEEFKTIDLLESSGADSSGIDSFALAVIKVERQARKLFTFLIFQYPCFCRGDSAPLRDMLVKKRIYSSGIFEGIDRVAPKTVGDLIGPDYPMLFDTVKRATDIRNKIFHGQVTNQRLERPQLFEYVHELRHWCRLLGDAAEETLGFDGFRNNSYQPTKKAGLAATLKHPIQSLDDYEALLNSLAAIKALKT